MPNNEARARLEAALGRAHRAVFDAKQAADMLGEDGTWLDLQQIESEILRISEGSLKGKGRRLTLAERQMRLG